MIHKRFADNTSENSIATRLRRERFRIFLEMLQSFSEPTTILDIGGTQEYWDMMVVDGNLHQQVDITLLNPERVDAVHPNFSAFVGDGRTMPQFSDRQFDIVFSNSTIEHVGKFEDQCAMAREIMRVGWKYYIQTPNRYFPIEPHFVFPLFQFLPISVRVFLIQHFNLGWYSRMPNRGDAYKEVASIRLMKKREVEALFPNAKIYEEKFLGLVKSFVAYTP
jgi:hypothetical protein